MSERPLKNPGSATVSRLLPFFLGLATVISLAAQPTDLEFSGGGFAILAVLLAVLATSACRRR